MKGKKPGKNSGDKLYAFFFIVYKGSEGPFFFIIYKLTIYKFIYLHWSTYWTMQSGSFQGPNISIFIHGKNKFMDKLVYKFKFILVSTLI